MSDALDIIGTYTQTAQDKVDLKAVYKHVLLPYNYVERAMAERYQNF